MMDYDIYQEILNNASKRNSELFDEIIYMMLFNELRRVENEA